MRMLWMALGARKDLDTYRELSIAFSQRASTIEANYYELASNWKQFYILHVLS